MDKKSTKSRRTKNCVGSKPKQSSGVSLPGNESFTGLSIRKLVTRGVVLCFEVYLAFAFGVFVVLYVYGRRIFRFTPLTENNIRNPYAVTKKKSNLCYDTNNSKNSDHNSIDDTDKVKPPRILEDPQLGIHKFIKIEGVKLHYVEAGGGRGRPVLLMVHGACDFWFTWRRLVPALSRRFRVVCLDMRGCGDSDKPLLRTSYTLDHLAGDVAALIRTLDQQDGGSGRVSLVGSGWGGQVCWRVAQQHPGLVHRMVLLHSPHPQVVYSTATSSLTTCYNNWPLLFVRLPALPEWSAAEGNLSLVSRLLGPLVRDKHVSPDEIAAYFYNFSRPEDLTGALHHLRNWDLFQGRSSVPTSVLTTPTLLLMGDADPNLPLEAGYKSAEYVERIKTRVLRGASSWAAVTHATPILEEMATFFNEPRILGEYTSSEEDWDDNGDRSEDEGIGATGRGGSLVGRMVGAGLSVVTRWTPRE